MNRVWLVADTPAPEQNRYVLELWKDERADDVTEDLLDILDKMHGDPGLWGHAYAA